jgi:hypothetical protein
LNGVSFDLKSDLNTDIFFITLVFILAKKKEGEK